MKRTNLLFTIMNRLALASLALSIAALASCGGSSPEPEAADPPAAPSSPTGQVEAVKPPVEPASQAKPAPTPPAPAAAAQTSSRVEVRDDSPEAAIETWVNALRAFDFDAAIAVLDPESRGAEMLRSTKAGYERAISDPALPIALMQTAIAGELQNLTWEMSAIDGESATFRFSSKAKAEPWEIRVVSTPDGWRVIPPPNGLPQG